MSDDELSRAVDRLVHRVGHWAPSRWRTPSAAGTRADAVHALIQRLADMCAAAEAEPRRAVPRLDNDLVLADQLRVVAADLRAAGSAPDVLAAAAEDVRAVSRTL